MIRNVKSGNDIINLENDGTPKLVAKPFELTRHKDGSFNLQILTQSPEEIAPYVPHIAAQIGCSEEQVIEMLKGTTGSYVERRPDTVHHALSFGGPEALRSAAKSALVLWATLTGNDEVRSPNYDDVRRFIFDGDEAFNLARVNLDARRLPQNEELQRRFGQFFSMIYVCSDEAGRVVARFTLYNLMSWCILLAEAGGTPNARVALIANPLKPAQQSITIADEIDIALAWLDSPDYTDGLAQAKERLVAAAEKHMEMQRAQELNRIATDVFAKNGIIDQHAPISDPGLVEKIKSEIIHRFGLHAVGIPYVEQMSGEELVARLRSQLKRKNRDG